MPAPAPPEKKSNATVLIVLGACIALVVLVVGGYLIFGGSSAKTYVDGGATFKVSSFTCGGRDRAIVEGPQGATVHPTHDMARGQWCVLEAEVTGSGTLKAEGDQLVDASGGEVPIYSQDLETITPPSRFYQPGPDPTLEASKPVKVRFWWDYNAPTPPAAAMLHVEEGSPGVRVPVNGVRKDAS